MNTDPIILTNYCYFKIELRLKSIQTAANLAYKEGKRFNPSLTKVKDEIEVFKN